MAEEVEATPAGDPLEPTGDSPGPEPKPPATADGAVPDTEATDDVAREVGVVVRTLLDLVGFRSRVRVEKSGDEYYATVRSLGAKGLLIGHRGSTLHSIQYLARTIVKKKFPDVPPIMIDLGGYRHHREKFLCQKAEAVARIVTQTGREMALDPLTDRERTTVEEHLRSMPEVRVYSVAGGYRQNVIIAPSGSDSRVHT